MTGFPDWFNQISYILVTLAALFGVVSGIYGTTRLFQSILNRRKQTRIPGEVSSPPALPQTKEDKNEAPKADNSVSAPQIPDWLFWILYLPVFLFVITTIALALLIATNVIVIVLGGSLNDWVKFGVFSVSLLGSIFLLIVIAGMFQRRLFIGSVASALLFTIFWAGMCIPGTPIFSALWRTYLSSSSWSSSWSPQTPLILILFPGFPLYLLLFWLCLKGLLAKTQV